MATLRTTWAEVQAPGSGLPVLRLHHAEVQAPNHGEALPDAIGGVFVGKAGTWVQATLYVGVGGKYVLLT